MRMANIEEPLFYRAELLEEVSHVLVRSHGAKAAEDRRTAALQDLADGREGQDVAKRLGVRRSSGAFGYRTKSSQISLGDEQCVCAVGEVNLVFFGLRFMNCALRIAAVALLVAGCSQATLKQEMPKNSEPKM